VQVATFFAANTFAATARGGADREGGEHEEMTHAGFTKAAVDWIVTRPTDRHFLVCRCTDDLPALTESVLKGFEREANVMHAFVRMHQQMGDGIRVTVAELGNANFAAIRAKRPFSSAARRS
jgi:hypothetical protein